ncbi:hypothetical protein CYLTODRAFT_359514 [Cylindrobasidium torrendii FP15055 ss-10]|uniref:Endonuclease/exonuclease/phosphatase domain-containing protein n=1 Tax=Cylindrobasidium torrendii FP15055 ss-10 TaxID=1314674 RepID=A0A0D7B0P1_9AGAR|nr:hypothetical protein CYLTODRAFT_359514 [Cylindrobasidium torrendii FP15055 ss-10]
MRFSSAIVLATVATHASALRLLSWNLRYDSKPDSISVADSIAALPDPLDAPKYFQSYQEQPWSTRRIRIAQHIHERKVSIIGVQEALIRQVNDLTELLGADTWKWVGVGRDDGAQAGEFSAIFYNTKDVSLVENDTFWLSNTPDEPTKFPGAGSIRLATYAKFTQGTSEFVVMNTHLDDQSDGQRRLGASMMLARAKYEAYNGGAGNGKVFLMGDYNSPPKGTDSGGYDITVGNADPVAVNATWAARYEVPAGKLDEFALLDLRAQAPRQSVSVNYATYTSWPQPGNSSEYRRIDFVFGGSVGDYSTDAYTVDSSLNDDGVWMSDHRPTVVEVSV